MCIKLNLKNMKITERSNPELFTQKDDYITGMLYVVNCCLTTEIFGFMIKEERCFGIVRSYWNSIEEAYDNIYKDEDSSIESTSRRLCFLFKPSLVREFKWLSKSKHLSEADSLIVISHKILDILLEVSEEHKYKNEIKTVHKVITRLFDNIRNRSKDVPLYQLANDVRTAINSGLTGKYESILRIRYNKDNLVKDPILGSKVRIKDESEKKIIEVSLE